MSADAGQFRMVKAQQMDAKIRRFMKLFECFRVLLSISFAGVAQCRPRNGTRPRSFSKINSRHVAKSISQRRCNQLRSQDVPGHAQGRSQQLCAAHFRFRPAGGSRSVRRFPQPRGEGSRRGLAAAPGAVHVPPGKAPQSPPMPPAQISIPFNFF